jgi:hypothetical protein
MRALVDRKAADREIADEVEITWNRPLRPGSNEAFPLTLRGALRGPYSLEPVL